MWEGLPTVLTVACEGGGSVAVTMESQQVRVAEFEVACPAVSAVCAWRPWTQGPCGGPSRWGLTLQRRKTGGP